MATSLPQVQSGLLKFRWILLLLLAGSLKAQTVYTWTGLGSDENFSTAANWQGGVAPAGNSTDILVFGNSPQENNLQLSTDLNLGSIIFTGGANNYYFLNPAPATNPTITLNGDITTNAGSSPWGVLSLAFNLTAGNHNITTNGSDIYLWNGVTGAGGITKSGGSTLIMSFGPNQSGVNDYSGGTTINGGRVLVGRDGDLGSGDVTFNSGTLASGYTADYQSQVALTNNFYLGNDVNFGSSDPSNVSLQIGSNELATTVAPVSGVTNVNLHVTGTAPLLIDGRMIDGVSGSTTYSFAGDKDTNIFNLSGNNSYTGGTYIGNGAYVIFEQAGSLPTTGLISGDFGSYAGLGDSSMDAATFVNRINHVNFAGTIGFENGGTYSGDIDLSTFSYTNVAIGTTSSATLTGTITPTADGFYNFNGSGSLSLLDGGSAGPLTGANTLAVSSIANRAPFMLILGRSAANDFSGDTEVSGAGIIYDSAGALSTASNIYLQTGGYVSVTDNSGLTLAALVSQVASGGSSGVIGFDSHGYLTGSDYSTYTYSGAVDFRTLSDDVYLGTSTNVDITGTIQTARNDAGDYFLTGYNRGVLQVDTQLTDSGANPERAVHVGLPGVYQDMLNGIYSSVELTNASNSFSGGIVLNSGVLILPANSDSVLGGPGPLVVNATASDGMAGLQTSGSFTRNITLQSGGLQIQFGGSLSLDGVISGGGSLASSYSFTLTGNNTYSGGSFFTDRSVITAASDHALGTGPINLDIGASIAFTSATPSIGSLVLGEPYTSDGTIQATLSLAGAGGTTLTINQTVDGIFNGSIIESNGVGSLVKTGPASLTIGGDSNYSDTPYSGGTTILQGKLIAGSPTALGTGPIAINGGTLTTTPGVTLTNTISLVTGTLGGTGTISSPITVGANATLSPGNSPGILTFAAGLTLNSGGTLNFEVQAATGTAGTGYDLVSISAGGLAITSTPGSPFTIKLISLSATGGAGNVSDFSNGSSYSWMLFNSPTGITGFAPANFTLDTSGFTNALGTGVFDLSQNGNPNAIFLNFTPVPEPSTYALMLGGLGLMTWTWRRRRIQ